MMKLLPKHLFTISLLLMVCLGGAGMLSAQTLKIGFVDLQKVIDASEEGKRAQEQIKQKADELSQQAKDMKEALNAAKDAYTSQAMALTEEARRQKEDEIARLERDYNRFISDSKVELRTTEQRVLKELLEEVGKVIVTYAADNEFTLVLESGNILYGAPSIEITDEIIYIYNAQLQQ